ncbi:MAG: glycosyltransferase family 4 protein, partial [Dehalococcoidia bacterium]|nr:glycosyltransferase family 4 protein [Dehalococcoidia bacterium]
MEKVAFELSSHLSRLTDVKLVKWGGSNKWLPIVLPYLLFKSMWALTTSDIKVIYLQDGLLAPLGVILKVFGKPVLVTVHGRDIAYENRLYQFLIPGSMKRLNRVTCVSSAIRDACLTKGVSADKAVVILNGISDEYYMNGDKPEARKKLEEILGKELGDRKILLSVGRFVEKKGIHWFVENVMPELANTGCAYVIAGDGVLASLIKKRIEENNLENSVFLAGWAEKGLLRILYNAADMFIMPNVPVNGDMEGFGLVALETASCGLPVVASDLEGIKDAIQDGKNGFLLEPGNARIFTDKIKELLENDELRQS